MTGFQVLGISWVGIGTDDFEGTFAFFRDVLGLAPSAVGTDQALLEVGTLGQQLEIFGREGRGKTLNTPPTFAFEVDDFDAAHSALVARGIEIVGDPGEWDGHRWVYFRGPGGFLFEIKTSPGFRRNGTP